MNVNRSPFGDAPPPQIGYPTSQVQPAQFGQEDDELDIRGLLLPFWRRKWLIALVTLIALALSVYAASQMQPRYTAFARVIFDPERMRIIDLESVIAARDITETGLQNQVEILRSFILLERVVDILRLEESPEFSPDEIQPPTIAERIANWLNLPGYAQQYLPENAEEFVPAAIQNRLAELGIMDPTQRIERTPEEEAAIRKAAMVTYLNDNLRLRPIPNSRVIEIQYTSTNPRLAASIVNTIGEQYIVVETENKRDDVAAATELLSTRVRDLETRLNSSKEAVELARLELSQREGQSVEMAQAQLDAANLALANLRLRLADAEARQDRAARALAGGEEFWAVTEFRDSATIREYRMRRGELEDEIASLRSIVGENASDPRLTRLQALATETERKIEAEARNIVAALDNEVASTREQLEQLAQQVRELEVRTIELVARRTCASTSSSARPRRTRRSTRAS